jgi:site-specific DNA recombinase
LFEKVQSMLTKKKTSLYYTNKIQYLHRGLVRCAVCERLYTPYGKKGIQYYGTRCPNGCPNPKKNFNISFLEDKVGELISRLSFTGTELAEIDARAKTDVAVFESKRLIKIEQNDRKKKKLREDLTYLRTNKLVLLKSGVYSPEAFLSEENKLNDQLVAFQDAEQISDVAMHEVIKDLIKLSELLKNGYEYYQNAESPEKAEIIHVIFSELFLSENTLTYKCRNGFKALQSRFDPVCGRGGT